MCDDDVCDWCVMYCDVVVCDDDGCDDDDGLKLLMGVCVWMIDDDDDVGVGNV